MHSSAHRRFCLPLLSLTAHTCNRDRIQRVYVLRTRLSASVQCPPPENPSSGKAIFTSCSYNSVVSYECKYGYTLIGEPTRRCGADKKWSGTQPKCKEINCGHPGNLYNGWLENIEAGTGLGASIIFRCHDGTKLEGHTSSVCQIDGHWRYPLPKCLAPCVVPGIQQGRIVLLGIHNETVTDLPLVVPHGEKLSVECDPQYEFLANNTPVACNNGTWTHIPRCEPGKNTMLQCFPKLSPVTCPLTNTAPRLSTARCKRLPKSPRNGMVIAPKIDHGMRARYKCKDGFTLRGGNITECQFGNWTGVAPYCQEVYCPFPGYIENGKVMLVGNMGLYDYRPYVRKVTNNKQIMYDCDRGYVLVDGPPGATCIGGRWSPKELPRCVPGMHPRLRWSRSVRGKRALMGQQKQIQNRQQQHQQHNKKQVQQVTERRRNKTKHERKNGRKKIGGKVKVKRDSREKNNEDYPKELEEMPPSTVAVVSDTGPCEVISTEPFIEVEVMKSGRDPNQTYSSGTLKWRPAKPQCAILPCHIPSTENSIYKLSSPEVRSSAPLNETADVANGEVVEFSCEPGYNVKGPSNLRCWHGEWDITNTPECTPAPCELPTITNGQYLSGYRAGLTIANGSSVTFQCDSDYSKSTAQPIECILGELRPRVPA
uniref:Sushi domain-containing protein n=1 Tax=Timema bartmani TaxID=61472 RepID=A0A7R9I2F1_9NEOP|nr:unnamed protein product [Timema bartmani]